MAVTPLFFSSIEKALRAVWEKRVFLLFTTALELVFFYVLTRVHVEVFMKIQAHIEVIMAALQEQTEQLADATAETVTGIQAAVMQQQEVLAAYHNVLALIGFLLLLVLANWLVLQGVLWWFAHFIARGKTPFWQHAWRFTWLTLIWFGFFVGLIVLLSLLTQYATFTVLPIIGQNGAHAIFLILLFLLGYVASVSYAVLPAPPLKKTWQLAAGSARQIFPAYLLMLLVWFVTGGLAFTLFNLHYSVSLAWIVLVTVPSFTLGRVYFIMTVQSVKLPKAAGTQA